MRSLDWLKARVLFYPTLVWNVVLGRWFKSRNWWDRIDTYVLLGALPFARDVPQLFDAGIRAVVNTCEEYAGPVEQYKSFDMEQMWMPTIDFTHPSYQDVCRAVEFIDKNVMAEKSVYIHCKAGRGRSATVAICWLMKDKQINASDAQRWLTEKRPHVNQHLTSRPVVQEFERAFVRPEQ